MRFMFFFHLFYLNRLSRLFVSCLVWVIRCSHGSAVCIAGDSSVFVNRLSTISVERAPARAGGDSLTLVFPRRVQMVCARAERLHSLAQTNSPTPAQHPHPTSQCLDFTVDVVTLHSCAPSWSRQQRALCWRLRAHPLAWLLTDQCTAMRCRVPLRPPQPALTVLRRRHLGTKRPPQPALTRQRRRRLGPSRSTRPKTARPLQPAATAQATQGRRCGGSRRRMALTTTAAP